MLHNQSRPVKSLPFLYHRNSDSGTRTRFPYPPDTKCFLYYFTLPEKPRISAELRLRVTTRDDPASFESGSDLLHSDGRPWSRPLCVLPRYYNPLYKKLREDRLVPDDLDAILSTSTSKVPKYRRSQLLYTLNDTFIVNFSYINLRFLVITEQGLEILVFRGPFFERRGGCITVPYTGAYSRYSLINWF
jgi:hypothetical protein